MRRFHRTVMLVALLALAPVLTACENFDPDKLDVLGLNKKKPLPGERKPLFPDGVPGVTQGIPPEYMKGHTEDQPGAAINVATPPPTESGNAPAAGEPAKQTAAAQSAAEQKPKPKAKPKPKPKPRQAARKPTQVTVQPSSKGQSSAQGQATPAAQQPAPAPWPEPAQQQPQQAQSPWPAPAQDNTPAPWPSAPPPGTFSKQ